MFTFKEVPYEMNEVRKYEDYVLKFLSFRLDYYSSFTILEFLLYNGIVFNNEIKLTCENESKSSLKEKIKTLNKLTFQILNSSIEEVAYTNFNHIELAFSCVVYARELMKLKNIYPVEFEKVYNIKLCNIIECYKFISL